MSVELLTNGRARPMGVQEQPSFSWRGDLTFVQKAYRISVTAEDGKAVWESGWVESGESQWIRTDFPLQSGTVYTWSCTLRDENGGTHELGRDTFETGLLHESDW